MHTFKWIGTVAGLALCVAPLGAQSVPKNGDRREAPKASKHSAPPPETDLSVPSTERDQDQKRRQVKEQHMTGLYQSKPVADPGLYDFGATDTTVATIVDGVYGCVAGSPCHGLEALPAYNSNLIVIGNVLSGKAFVTGDRTHVYSDYQVKVEQVLKPDATRSVSVGSQIAAMRSGGIVHFPSGHTKRFIIHREGHPEIGGQYVFFLRNFADSIDYEITTAYQLKNGVVLPLNDGRLYEVYEGVNVADFLSQVRAAITAAAGEPR